MTHDVSISLAEMQSQLSTIRDLSLFAEHPEQKAYLVHAAELIEKAVREHGRKTD